MAQKKKGKGKKVFLGIIFVFLLVIVGVGIIFGREYTRKTTDGKEIEVEIPEGTSTKELIALLKDKGVIRFQLPFYVKLYRSSYRGKLRYGSYKLNDGMSLDDIIVALSKGGGRGDGTLVLTVPEGYTIEMIAQRVEEMGLMSGEDFLKAVNNAAAGLAESMDLPKAEDVYYPLQGYLFPDTYYLEKDITPSQLVSIMLTEFNEKFDQKRQERAKELGMTVTEVLTKASLVQKETDLPEEYATIAGVINNRIKSKMKLQFDSTVVYAMTEGKYGVDRVMYSDLKYDSPYNTYQNYGLPVGPICNPSIEAIDAVLYPEEHNYLFFQTDMVKNDGSNLFFETYEEHLAASSTANRGGETTKTEATEATTENNKK